MTTKPEFKCVLQTIRDSSCVGPKRWTKLAAVVKGVNEKTTAGLHRLKRGPTRVSFFSPSITVNDCVAKSKSDSLCGCGHSLRDGIMRALDVMVGGECDLVCAYGDVGSGCEFALRGPVGRGGKAVTSGCTIVMIVTADFLSQAGQFSPVAFLGCHKSLEGCLACVDGFGRCSPSSPCLLRLLGIEPDRRRLLRSGLWCIGFRSWK